MRTTLSARARQLARRPAALHLAVVTLGVGYPVARMLLPGEARVLLFVPLGLLLLWLAWRWTQPRPTVQSPLAWPLLLCGAALALSSLFASVSGVVVVPVLFDWLQVGVLLFLALAVLDSGWSPRLLVHALMITTSVALFAALGTLLVWWAQWAALWQPGAPWLPVGFRQQLVNTHPNQAAALINLGVPLVIGALWVARAGWLRWLWAGWLLVAVIVLFHTSSRGGWLGTAAATGWMLAPLLWAALRSRQWRRLVAGVLLAAAYGALFLALLTANLREIEAQRNFTPRSSATTTIASAETVSRLTSGTGRAVFWQRAQEFFWSAPLTGVGPGGYAALYLIVEPHSRFFPAAHAHNQALTLLSETGLVGALALAVLAGTAAWVWWRGWQQASPLTASAAAGSLEGRVLLLACAGVLVGLGVHGLVDVQVVEIQGMALLVGAAGVAAAWNLRRAPLAHTKRPQMVRWLHAGVVAGALLAWGVSGYLFVQIGAQGRLAEAARHAIQQGDTQAALALYDESLARYPWAGSAYSGRATTLARLAQADPAYADEAQAALAVARQNDPANRSLPVNEAALLIEDGQLDRAATLLRATIEADQGRWIAPFALLAEVREQQGNPDEAAALWQQALAREASTHETVACQQSPVCRALPLPTSEYADLRAARDMLRQPTPPTAADLAQIEAAADYWSSVDIWAVGVLAARQAAQAEQAARFLAAAEDQAEIAGDNPTPQLAIAQLDAAVRRQDNAALRELLAQWLPLPAVDLVPQLERRLFTRTDAALAGRAVEAAAALGDPRVLAQAEAYQARVADAFANTPGAQP